jgi:hypothetical protein
MVHTLEALQSGELLGVKRLKLACGLETFPEEIFTLADTLQVLDLSDNNLSALPDNISKLKHLKIIFFARNKFTAFPSVLADCPALTMIGFKSNNIKTVPEQAFPPLLEWLILTDNKIEKLPKSLGDCGLLRKCALAGNLIEELPEEMTGCVSLELIRVSANQLKTIPEWLFELPKLSWVAFGGNPGADTIEIDSDLESFNWEDFEIKELLGEGASGLISKAHWSSEQKDVAIKVFKGAVTSDGLPDDEMAIAIAAGNHENLISVLGKIKEHPEDKSGLIMTLISPSFENLGNPPSFDTCTRDVFHETSVFNAAELLIIAKSMASVCKQLHAKGINHGDLYAHNILINSSANSLLGDFGAASFYNVNSVLANSIERVEVRAFGCLVEDVLGLVAIDQISNELRDKWQKLITACFARDVKYRLNFSEILEMLETF